MVHMKDTFWYNAHKEPGTCPWTYHNWLCLYALCISVFNVFLM